MSTARFHSQNLGPANEPLVGAATTAFVVATWLFVTLMFLFPLKQSWAMSVDANYTRVFVDYSERDAGGAWTRSAAIASLGLFGLWAFLRRDGHALRVQGLLTVIWIAFVIWCGMSIFWADSPKQALVRFIGDACGLLAALGIARNVSPRQFVWIVFGCALSWLALGFTAEVTQGTFRPWDGEHRFAGVFHANGMGGVCALLVLSAVYLARREPRRKKLLWMAAAVGLVFLYLTRSRTALIAAMLIGTVAMLYLASFRRAAVALMVFTALMAVALPVLSDRNEAADSAAAIGRDASEESSLTARLTIWDELMPYIGERPLLGYSYSFWSEDIELTEPAQSAHSSYVDLALRFGLIGAALYVVGMLLAIARASRIATHRSNSDCGFLVMLFAFTLITGIFETTIGFTDAFGLFAICGISFLAFRDDLAAAAASQAAWPPVAVQMTSLLNTGIAGGYRES